MNAELTDDTWYQRLRHLGLRRGFCLSFVRGIAPEEALRRLGAPRPGPVAVPVGGWVLLVENDHARAARKILGLSYRTEAITVDNGPGDSFVYARHGAIVATFNAGEHYADRQSVQGPLAGELAPFVAQLRPRGLPRDVELACLLTGVRPQPTDFDRALVDAGADWYSRRVVR